MLTRFASLVCGLALLATAASAGEPVSPLRGYWQPGGYEARVGSPYYYSVPGFPVAVGGNVGAADHCRCDDPAQPPLAELPGVGTIPVQPPVTVYNFPYRDLPRDPYTYHFGPGFYRRAEYGHYRFPYYTYRAPWYFPGHPVYNRDTNFPW